jgi:hypothetical protein
MTVNGIRQWAGDSPRVALANAIANGAHGLVVLLPARHEAFITSAVGA